MKKLYEILGQRKTNGDVGVEIEVEGSRLPDDVDPRWNATVDGSLRGENREYVMRKPLPVAEVPDALNALAKNLKDNRAKLDFSFRTSVHVHVNCQELTYNQYLNLLYTYFLLEEPLMTFCGRERKGNRFCLRLQDAEGMLETYNALFRHHDGEGFVLIPANRVRYSAMNIEATTKYGSLEFRGMKGNMDVEHITTWVNALIYLREFAKSVDDPTQVYNLFAELEAQGFMEHVLKDLAARFHYARAVRDMQKSFSLSIDLPFTFGATVEKKLKAEADALHIRPARPRAARVADIIEPVPMPPMPEGMRIGEFIQANAVGAAPRAPRVRDPLAGHADPFAEHLRAIRQARPVRREEF